jgi:hypothetical protein
MQFDKCRNEVYVPQRQRIQEQIEHGHVTPSLNLNSVYNLKQPQVRKV